MSSNTNQSLLKKTAARTAAVQCVYSRAVNEDKASPASLVTRLKKRLANNAAEQKLVVGSAIEPNYPLVLAILEGTIEFETQIDEQINSVLSKEWKRDRMSPVLIAVLQCAVFELFFFKAPKHKIIIDEYTRTTSRFFADAEVNFVHGALNNLHKKIHE